jgi:hypothetical protein
LISHKGDQKANDSVHSRGQKLGAKREAGYALCLAIQLGLHRCQAGAAVREGVSAASSPGK